MKYFSTEQLVRFLRQTFFLGMALSVSVYIWVRLLFFEAPLSISEETINLFKVIMTGWLMIIALKVTFYTMIVLGEHLPALMKRNKLVKPILFFLFTGGVLMLFIW